MVNVIYTDKNRNEVGVLHEYDIDFNTVGDMDYVLDVGYDNHVLSDECWWYIEGTEYAGIVDSITVNTSTNTIQYAGRNLRGILNSKVIKPPHGQDYKIVLGALEDIVSGLLSDASLQGIFTTGTIDGSISTFQFNRYITLYEGLESLASKCNKVLALEVKQGKVIISFREYADYSDFNEYGNRNVFFEITKKCSTVNHLICLGQGDLKDRTVVHLYVDKAGSISDKQYYFGLKEREETYEYTQTESEEELRQAGIEHLQELISPGEFEVHTEDTDLKIGDIIGGYERITGYRIKSQITNIVAKINDNEVSIEYTVDKNTVEQELAEYNNEKYYEIPIASCDVLGCIRIGNLGQYSDGTIYLTDSQSEEIEELVQICR